MKTILVSFVLGWAVYGQNTLNLSQDLVRLNIAPTNLVPNDPTQDSGPLFFRGILAAKNRSFDRVIVDPGAYYFLSQQYAGGPHVQCDSLSNLTIDFQGSDLIFTLPLAAGISFSNSTNIVVQNFTVDYDPLPFTQVRVVSVNPAQQQIQFAVDGNWQNPTALNATFSAPSGGVDVHFFRYGRPIPGVSRLHASNPIGSSQFTVTPDPGLTPSAIAALIRPGDIAFLCMRGLGPSVVVLNCIGCTARNIAIYSGAAVGFEGGFARSSLLERIYVIPKPGTDRLASNFTGIQMSGGLGNQIRLNRLIRTMDNGIEYSARFVGTVKSQTDSRTFVLEGLITSELASGFSAPNGSAVSFQRPLDGSIVNSAIIASQVAPAFTGQNPYQVTYTFDRDLPSSIVSTLMFGTDPDSRATGSVVERNASEEETGCCNAFFIPGLGDGVFRGNYAQRAAMSGLVTENSMQPGNFNSPPAANFAISNNVVDSANWVRTGYPLSQVGSIEVYATNAPVLVTASPQQNISITGNFIADSGTAAVWLGNTNGGTVSGNDFLHTNINAALESIVSFFGPSTLPVVVQSSQNVATSNNVVDQASGRVWVTDGQYRELAAYAPGSTIRLNGFEIGTLSNLSVVLTDADGNVNPITVQASTAHAIDVQIPASAALGGAHLTLTAGSFKSFGTLFLDSQDNIPALNGCTYEVSPAAFTTGANANSLAILVVTQAGCSYGVTVKDPFVTGTASAVGAAVVSVGFAANTGAARTTAIEIAGQPLTLTQAASGVSRPVIQAIVDPWNYGSGVAPGEWVTITGTALAAGPPHTWNLNATQLLPTSLGGVTLSFNGKPAALLYVSATQINALVPATVFPGSVQVMVESNGVSGDPFTITATATRPAIYALPTSDGATFFVTAALAGTATLVGNSAVDPRVLRAVQPGDVLDLYMVGLGGTMDSSKFVTDQLFAGAYPVSAMVSATVGGEPAVVSFAGLTAPGLYLVRIAIPQDLSPGAQMIQVSAGPSKTGSSLRLLLSPAS